jgi:hypothetical protein
MMPERPQHTCVQGYTRHIRQHVLCHTTGLVNMRYLRLAGPGRIHDDKARWWWLEAANVVRAPRLIWLVSPLRDGLTFEPRGRQIL